MMSPGKNGLKSIDRANPTMRPLTGGDAGGSRLGVPR